MIVCMYGYASNSTRRCTSEGMYRRCAAPCIEYSAATASQRPGVGIDERDNLSVVGLDDAGVGRAQVKVVGFSLPSLRQPSGQHTSVLTRVVVSTRSFVSFLTSFA